MWAVIQRYETKLDILSKYLLFLASLHHQGFTPMVQL